MTISAIKDFDTHWTPYAVTFSHDGGRLAVGGGSWHGHGGIIVAALDDWRNEPLDWAEVPWVAARGLSEGTTSPSGVPAVSSLCFSDDDRVLAASMWSSRQHYAPTMTFEVDGTHVHLRDLFEMFSAEDIPGIQHTHDERAERHKQDERIHHLREVHCQLLLAR